MNSDLTVIRCYHTLLVIKNIIRRILNMPNESQQAMDNAANEDGVDRQR